VYNRFLWNFTKGEGEVAYALSYNMRDVDYNGFIDEADGRTLYLQGHGDAWGHYLSALKLYYDLLNHSEFNWEARSEKFSVEGVVIDVDYSDERKFVESAASKAKVGSEVVNMTYRKYYVDDPEGQWQGYTDSDSERAWGVTGWSRRAFMGALFEGEHKVRTYIFTMLINIVYACTKKINNFFQAQYIIIIDIKS